MSQISFSDAEYAGKRKKTRRKVFLEEMERVVPWKALLGVISPHYPVAGRGRRPYPMESMRALRLEADLHGDRAVERGRAERHLAGERLVEVGGHLVALDGARDRDSFAQRGQRLGVIDVGEIGQEVGNPCGDPQWPRAAAVAERVAPALARKAQVGENRPARDGALGDQRALPVVELAGAVFARLQRGVAPHRIAEIDRDLRVDPERIGGGSEVARRTRHRQGLAGDALCALVVRMAPAEFGVHQVEAQDEGALLLGIERRLRDEFARLAYQLGSSLAVALAQVPRQRHQGLKAARAEGGEGALLSLQLLLVDDEGIDTALTLAGMRCASPDFTPSASLIAQRTGRRHPDGAPCRPHAGSDRDRHHDGEPFE